MKRIVIINGHPDSESFNHALQQAYKNGALSSGNEIEEVTLSEMNFSPNLRFGYRKRTDLEPDLLEAWRKIQWAEHIVWIYPTWWFSMPALMKGFIDRLFLPGFTFEYQSDSPFAKKLLTGKSSEIIVTMDTPVWYYKTVFANAGVRAFKSALAFCGIRNKRTTYLAVVKTSTDEKRKKWLQKVQKLGAKN